MSQTTKLKTSLKELLQVHQHFSTSVSLLSGNYGNNPLSKYRSIHAYGADKVISANSGSALVKLQQELNEKKEWRFGVLGYDLKNEIEELSSKNLDALDCPDIVFFEPKVIVVETEKGFEILKGKASDIKLKLDKCKAISNNITFKLTLQPRIDYLQYEEGFQTIQDRILLGDFYEINYCQEFYQENAAVDLLSLFINKQKQIDSPFMGYFQHKNWKMVSFSPERYLTKRGHTLISQPIKGTAKRGLTKAEDNQQKKHLRSSIKERTENTMIVDLVRNDLGKCAKPGKVTVSEYLQLYSFPNIHQLISTIEAEISPDLSFSDIIKNTFPMGSMTGAPKLRVMQAIEEIEQSKRGWYSGALGYISPDQNFDFNVIIRSLIYNSSKQYLSCHVGGAITTFSKCREEYEECLTKLNSIIS